MNMWKVRSMPAETREQVAELAALADMTIAQYLARLIGREYERIAAKKERRDARNIHRG